MRILTYNVRGFGGRVKRRVVRKLREKQKGEFIYL